MSAEDHEVRTLKWRMKQLGKQLGRAGATIHQLRGENAALREAVKFPPGEYQRLFAQLRASEVENRRLKETIRALREQIPEETPTPQPAAV